MLLAKVIDIIIVQIVFHLIIGNYNNKFSIYLYN